MNIKQRHFIKSSEIKTLKTDILKQYNAEFINQIIPNKARIEVIYIETGDTLYAINGELKLWKSNDDYIPVLTLLLKGGVNLKTIIVDMGAIRFVTNGADIMRPGIIKIDPLIQKGDIVSIADETHGRPLAVGKAMYDAEEMEKITKGKVIKNLHTIKDSIWTFSREFR